MANEAEKSEELPEDIGTYSAESARVLMEIFGVHSLPQHLEPVKALCEYFKMAERRQENRCCYCESAVHLTSGHIEHLAPRSTDSHKTYDYNNLALSCNGSSDKTGSADIKRA